MIPKANLPFLKPLPEQVKRKKMVDSKRKIRANYKRYRTPKVTSPTFLKNQVKRFVE